MADDEGRPADEDFGRAVTRQELNDAVQAMAEYVNQMGLFIARALRDPDGEQASQAEAELSRMLDNFNVEYPASKRSVKKR